MLLVIAAHILVAIVHIGGIGVLIERVLHVATPSGNLLIVRVGQRHGMLPVGIFIDQLLPVTLRFVPQAETTAYQEHVVIDIFHLFVFGEVAHQALQGALGHREVLHILLLKNAGIVQPVGQQGVRRRQLILRKRNLPEIILTLMGIVGQRVFQGLVRIVFRRLRHSQIV